jgi:hypothetical protein
MPFRNARFAMILPCGDQRCHRLITAAEEVQI